MTFALPNNLLPKAVREPDWSFDRWAYLARATWQFGRRHRASLIFGGLAALVVIAIRLALPVLFTQLLKPMLSGTNNHRQLSKWLESSSVEPTLIFGVGFLLLLTLLGFADLIMRLRFARFAIGTVRDLRARAFQSALQVDPAIRVSDPGELVARLIGDSARVKEGLKGFLVHVATNGGLFIGVSAVLIFLNPLLGSIVAAAFVLILIVTLFGTTHVYHRASKLRSKEGRLAQEINKAYQSRRSDEAFATINASSGEHEATVTRIQGRTTWAAHVIFGVAVLLVVWLGMRMVATRELATADMLLFIMYALTCRQPMVQLTRQGTRTGKILACLDRLDHLLETGRQAGTAGSLEPLKRVISVAGVHVHSSKSRGSERRLAIVDLRIAAGSRVAVVGRAGAGKTTLLELLAGRITPQRGEVRWDDQPLLSATLGDREARIASIAQVAEFPRQRIWQFLGLDDATITKDNQRAFRRFNAAELMARLPSGLDTKVGSDALSPGECRALALARAVLNKPDLLLLDDPCVGLSPAMARRRLKNLLRLGSGTTIVAAFTKLPDTKIFDRVLKLHRGKIIFDGDRMAFAGWNAQRKRAAAEGAAHALVANDQPLPEVP